MQSRMPPRMLSLLNAERQPPVPAPRLWDNEPSKINYYPASESDSLFKRMSQSAWIQPEDTHKEKPKIDDDLLQEQFPFHMTSLMNEDHLWGCFYPFPELYNDVYCPVVKIRKPEDVPVIDGVLTRDMVSTCLTYPKRNAIHGDLVYIKLNLCGQHLVNIEVLRHYRYLVYLDLSTNLLTELTELSHMPYLQYLSVSFNRLSKVLDYEVPQWFLSEVHYKYNSVKRIADLSKFWSITLLDLSHNNIMAISGLQNLYYLRHLDLSFNHIQRLENLNNLRLVWLDVSYNNISTFEYGPNVGLWTLYHLEYLNLNENNLTSLKIFAGCSRLQDLYIRNNRLSVLLELAVYMKQLRRLSILDLRANPICSSPGYKEVVINTFPTLLSLDAEELDPVSQRRMKMRMSPHINEHSCSKLLRLLYIEQLHRARVSPCIPPADTTEVPLVIFVGYEAIGKGTLLRRLAAQCPNNIEIAHLHTTATYHMTGLYREVSRSQFDDMLLAGDFLTYYELDGESYGLSRKEAFVTDGKVKVTTMDLNSALMMKMRGRRPYLILTTLVDKFALSKRQQDRRELRFKWLLEKILAEYNIEESTLQVILSGRILITGIINEILMRIPDEKNDSEFVIESKCSLLLDSETRQAVQNYAKGINMLTLLASSSSIDNLQDQDSKDTQIMSLYSLYKGSQNTDEYISNMGQNYSYQDSKRSGVSRNSGDMRHPKNTSQTLKDSMKSSKSVTFTSQDENAAAGLAVGEGGEGDRGITGMLVDPPMSDGDAVATQSPPAQAFGRSVSKKFPKEEACNIDILDDADLWFSFLVETGLLQTSDLDIQCPHSTSNNMEVNDQRRSDPKIDDIDLMRQLTYYRMLPSQSQTTNIRDDYEDIHRKCPGLFWDTIRMDDMEKAVKKAKRIIKNIVNSQSDLKPMFEIDFANMTDEYPTIKKRIEDLAQMISPTRYYT